MSEKNNLYDKGLIKYTGVMLNGKMKVLTDQETKDMIWRRRILKHRVDGAWEIVRCIKYEKHFKAIVLG